jgi:hypothetical protein
MTIDFMGQSRQSQPVRGIAQSAPHTPHVGPRRQTVDIAAPARLSTPEILALQRDAGNQAVTAVLQAQAAPVLQSEETIASRLKEAKTRLDKGELDDAAWDICACRGG